MLCSWKILLVGMLLVAGCQADTIERYPYHTHDDDDDDDGLDLDWDIDGDIDLEADADLDVDVDVDVNADFDIASKIGDAFNRVTDRVTDATRGSIIITNDPHRNTYTTRPTDRPTRTLRPTRTPRPTTRPTRTTRPTTRPTPTPRPTTRPTRPTRTTRPTTRPPRTTRPTTDGTRRPDRTEPRDRSDNGNTGNANTNGSTETRDNTNANTNTNGNTSANTDTSGSGAGGNSRSERPLTVEVGELFQLTESGTSTTLAVEDEDGNAVHGALLRLDGNSLRKLFLVRALDEHHLVVRSTAGTRRVPLTGRESRVEWELEHEATKVTLNIEEGLVADHLSAHIAVKLHLVTVSGTRLISTARTANIALLDGRGTVAFVLQGADARLSFSSGCYRWGVESLSSNRVMFGDEFGARCR